VAKKKEAPKAPTKLAVKQVRSLSGRPESHRRTMRALGFTRNQQIRVHNDTPAIRGMIEQIKHLVIVNEIEE